MKKSSYMTRALKARDPRYVRILSNLGYERADMTADETAPVPKPAPRKENPSPQGAGLDDDRAVLRKQYQEIVGKKPFAGWDAETLKAKIADATKA